MNMATLQTLLLWCTVINYVILIIWFAAFVLVHDAFFRLHSRWFSLSKEQFDAMNYGSMAVYKIGIMLLNLVPLIALWMMNR
ncbi:MAG: DUF6868 family protein [Acidobacteriota bacterium]